MDVPTLIIIAIAILVSVLWFRAGRQRSARRDFQQKFGVEPEARVIQADMGRDHNLPDNKILFADGMSGKPDVVFKHHKRLIVGEFKKASIRGRVRRRDYYQITLYMGMLQRKHPRAEIEGRVLYANERRDVEFDPQLYQELLGHRAECLALLNEAGV